MADGLVGSLASILGSIRASRVGEKIADLLGAAGGGYLYSMYNIEVSGDTVYVKNMGWVQYGTIAGAAVADVLLDIPVLHGVANGVVGAAMAHLRLLKGASATAPQSGGGGAGARSITRVMRVIPK